MLCEEPRKLSSANPEIWQQKLLERVRLTLWNYEVLFCLFILKIYAHNLEEVSDLSTTLSLHNPNVDDKIYFDKPIFEEIVITIDENQGISFVTDGKRIER